MGAPSPFNSLGAADLPTFDGTITWDSYRIQLDTIPAENGWSDHTNTWMLVTKPRGRVTELLQNVPAEHLGTYSVLAGLLADHYRSSGNRRVEYQRLCSHRQEFGETYQDLAVSVERLAVQSLSVAPQNTAALIGNEACVEAIRHPEV